MSLITYPEAAAPATTVSAGEVPAVVFDKVSRAFDDNVVLQEISFTVSAARMLMLLGASGTGKSVVLKLILGLRKPDSGAIRINGTRIDTMSEPELMTVRGGIGMLFQESALFDSLSVADNVGYRLYEETDRPAGEVRRAAASRRSWGSSVWTSTSIECRRSCQVDSGPGSPSHAPWRRGRRFSCSTIRHQGSTPSRRRPWTTRSSSCGTWSTSHPSS